MPARRPSALLLGALVVSAAAALAACDFAGAEGIAGRWAGTAQFEADTILAAHNARITADYQTAFTFELTDDEGLITGQVTARTTGYRIVREAGQPADTLYFDATPALVNELFGTFIDPTLEMDVPDGPYEDGLWTFEVSGRRADLDQRLTHTLTIPLADSTSFPFVLQSSEAFEMQRVADEQ